MTTKTPAKPHYATSNFTDAGTKRSFTAGDEITDATAGQLGNYAAAGLASIEKPKVADTTDTATKPAA